MSRFRKGVVGDDDIAGIGGIPVFLQPVADQSWIYQRMNGYPFSLQKHFAISAAKATLKVKSVSCDWRKRSAHYRLCHLVYEGIEEVIDQFQGDYINFIINGHACLPCSQGGFTKKYPSSSFLEAYESHQYLPAWYLRLWPHRKLLWPALD